MKKLLSYLFYLAIATVAIQSCTPEDDTTTTKTGPVVNFISGNNNIDDDAIVTRNAYFKVVLSATKGTAGQLKTFEVLADGVSLDPTKMKINGAAAAANPVLLFAPDVDGVSNYAVEILSTNVADTVKYTFKFTDNAGNSDSEVINIFTLGDSVTVVNNLKVYNSSSPAGFFGSVDLINGVTVAKGSASAQLEDYGVQSPTNSTWLMRFLEKNGSNIRTSPASFNFDAVSYADDIKAAYELGTDSPNNDILMTKDLVFLVNQGTKYFAVKVNDLVATSNDNLDYSIISIKK